MSNWGTAGALMGSPMADNLVIIYVHGSCRGNPGPGGWGALSSRGGQHRERKGWEASTTNVRMELVAAITALNAIKPPSPVRLHTTCQVIIQGATEWLPDWKSRGWRKARGEPVQNADLWKELDRLSGVHRIEWCKSQVDDPGSQEAKALAHRAIAGQWP